MKALIAMIIGASFLLGACNTVEGVGKDVKAGAGKVEQEAKENKNEERELRFGGATRPRLQPKLGYSRSAPPGHENGPRGAGSILARIPGCYSRVRRV